MHGSCVCHVDGNLGHLENIRDALFKSERSGAKYAIPIDRVLQILERGRMVVGIGHGR